MAVKGWPPKWLTADVAEDGFSRGDECLEFINTYCRITKTSVGGRAGELIRTRPWQDQLVRALLLETDEGKLQHRQALIGVARKNGKSGLGSGIALWSLFCGEDGGEVYSCAGTREQARIVFAEAKKMVELDPELSSLAKVFRDAIEIPSTGSVYRVLSSEAGASEGLNPTLTMFDEVHVQPDDELWNVLALGTGARHEPLHIGITTAGAKTNTHGGDSFCYWLYQYGCKVASGEIEDNAFFFSWWEPVLGAEADHSDPQVWAEANPGLGDLNSLEDFESALKRTQEAEFRTKRTNVWVTSSTTALPNGKWEQLADADRVVEDGSTVVLMADGSWSGDSTAIVGYTVEEVPHLFVVGLWEKPEDGFNEWRVPISDVETAILEAAKKWRCVEISMDPYRWQRSIQQLEDNGLPMMEFPMGSVSRMVSAWKSFYDAVLDSKFTHDGSPALARHVANMVLKIDAKGARPTKETRVSNRHIDLGICAVAGYDRAMFHLNGGNKQPEPFVFFA
jgi:phage terminase large subunit-like protein